MGGVVGTVYDFVNAGAIARFGFALPDDYGPPRIEPSLPGTNFFQPTESFGWYLFAGVDGRAIARNLFLDGNTWEASRHVEKIPLVGDLQFGAAITFEQWRLSFMHVFRTRDIRRRCTPTSSAPSIFRIASSAACSETGLARAVCA